MSPDEAEGWRADRTRAAQLHAQRAERAARADEAKARALIAEFLARARQLRLPTVPLQATSYNGRRYRTGRTGWYLRRNHSVGLGDDGAYYLLRVPPTVSAWLRGARVQPSPPPLVVCRGGRDGDAIELVELLRLRLAAGPDF